MAYKEAVKKLRLKMFTTQEEFAKLLDASFTTINGWEIGKYVSTIKARRKIKPYFEKYSITIDEEWHYSEIKVWNCEWTTTWSD